MHAHEHGFVAAQVTLDECHVLQACGELAERDEAEVPVLGGEVHFLSALHQALAAESVGDEVGDGDELESPLVGTAAQLGQTGHGAVVAHDLHECGDWL